MSDDSGSVGILDSGVGGLSVMRHVATELPHEDVLFFADSIHCPYGRRTYDEIQDLTSGIAHFLVSQGAKIVVVACNTASAAALQHLRKRFDVPIVGMEPALKPAAEHSVSKVVGVIATEVTFQGALFASLMERFSNGVDVLTRSCPGLVEQVEAGLVAAPTTREILEACLAPMVEAGVDSLVLGCTHYPFLRPLMEEILGDGVEIFDPGLAVARQTARVLEKDGLLRQGVEGRYTFYTSGHPQRFARMLEELTELRGPVLGVEWVGGAVRPVGGQAQISGGWS
jgi:glutamate racemase